MTKLDKVIGAALEDDKVVVPPEIAHSYRDAVEAGLAAGLTDELRDNAYLSQFKGGIPAFLDVDGVKITGDPLVPTLVKIIESLPIEDDPTSKENPRSKLQKFIEDFPKKQKEWKEYIEENQTLGKNGWLLTKELWKRALKDKTVEEQKKAMHDAVHDGTLSGFLARTLFPRATEHIENEGDFDTKDMALDIGENVAMLAPGGVISGFGGSIARKLAPGAFRKASAIIGKMGEGTLKNVVKRIPGAVSDVIGNAAVPLASEIADAISYGEGEGMDQRADFSIGDVLTGTLINKLIDRNLYRKLLPGFAEFSGEIGRVASAGGIREVLEAGASSAKAGADYARKTRAAASGKYIPEGIEGMTPEMFGMRREGNMAFSNLADQEAVSKAKKVSEILDAIDQGKIGVKTKKEVSDLAKKNKANHADESVAEYVKYSDILNVPENMKETLKGLGKDELDNIINYATWYGKGSGKAKTLEQVGNVVKQAIPAWGKNKAGRDDDVKRIFNHVPVIGTFAKDNQKETHEAPWKRSASSELEKLLESDPSVDSVSARYIKDLIANPDIVKYGHPTDPSGFNLWLLEKGHDILRGTKVHRPVWKIGAYEDND